MPGSSFDRRFLRSHFFVLSFGSSLLLVLCGCGLALSLEPAGTRHHGGMKVGRGHVCNINPSPSWVDQTLVGIPHHVAIGPRSFSLRGGSDTLVMTSSLLTYFSSSGLLFVWIGLYS